MSREDRGRKEGFEGVKKSDERKRGKLKWGREGREKMS